MSPAPGISRSITYFGIIRSHSILRVLSIQYHWYGSIHTMSTDVKGSSGPSGTGLERRAAQGAATRASLLQAALELFGSEGFADTSLDDVVARAQVTKGALYHHFGSKE